MATVSLKNLSNAAAKGREVTPVHDLDLAIGDREFAVVAGPPRAGKTTILRLIAGLETASAGEIFIGDRSVTKVLPKDREVAMVFRNYALYPHMSVHANVAFGLKVRKFPKSEIDKRVRDAAAILALEKLLERRPAALSMEERLRVALARALVRQPKVFLFDQPLANLDAAARAQMQTEIAKLHQRLETTMIYTTEDPLEALSLADRVVVMRDGVVQQSDAPAAIYDAPANIFVASFLGNPPMNLVHGSLKQERDALLFREREEGTIEIRFANSERPELSAFAGQSIILGIRPEDIALAPATSAKQNAPGTFQALLEVVQSLGSKADLHLQTGAHALIARSLTGVDRREAGRRVRCSFEPGAAHFFDPASGRRITRS